MTNLLKIQYDQVKLIRSILTTLYTFEEMKNMSAVSNSRKYKAIPRDIFAAMQGIEDLSLCIKI